MARSRGGAPTTMTTQSPCNPPGCACDITAATAPVLSFRVGSKELGLESRLWLETRTGGRLHRIDGAPDCVIGALSWRDRQVPVVDLRIRHGLAPAAPGTSQTTLLVCVERTIVGIVVDEVFGPVDLRGKEVLPSPGCADIDDPGCVTGVCMLARDGVQRVLILVDIARLIGRDPLTLVDAPPCPGHRRAKGSTRRDSVASNCYEIGECR